MKRGLPVLLLLAALAASYAVWRSRQAGGGVDLNGRLTLYGNVELRDAQLAFNGNDRVAEVLVEEGQRVVPGQLLARLHTERLEARLAGARAREAAQTQTLQALLNGTRPEEVAQAEAQVLAARARVENAKLGLARLEQTLLGGASTEQAQDDARAQLRVELAALEVQRKALALAREGPRAEDVAAAQAQLEALAADRTLLEVQLADSELRAPSIGIVQARLLEPGELANVGAPALTLALVDPKWVRVYVSEPDLGRLAGGMQATVESDSFPGERFPGWVGFMSSQAEFTPKSVETTDLRPSLVYEARIYVSDPDDRLRLGQPVTVTVDPAAPRVEVPAPVAAVDTATDGRR